MKIFASSLLLLASSNALASDINLICSKEPCELEREIQSFFLKGGSISQDIENVNLINQGVVVDSVFAGDLSHYNSINLGGVTVQDTPLNCDYDRDFTCDEWGSNKRVAAIQDYLHNLNSLALIVDQDLINRKVAIKDWFVGVVTAIPVGRIASMIAQLGKTSASRILAESVAASTLTSFVNSTFDGQSLEEGDVIVIDPNGKAYLIKKDAYTVEADSETEASDGSSSGSAGGGGESTGSSSTGAGSGGRFVGGGSGYQGGSARVCTGEAGSLVCYTIKF